MDQEEENQMRSIKTRALTIGFAGALALSAFSGTALAASGPDSPTATHDNPSSCLGAERATRNSNGGDRAQGGFGPVQSDFVQSNQPYGQWLKEWKADC